MRRDVRRALLALAKRCGAFRVALRLTRSRLRVLCYHGISLDDEHEFKPAMFVRAETLRRRLSVLRRLRVSVVSIDEGVRRLVDGRIADAETVITFDDGFESTYSIAAPILAELGLPFCVYATTDHFESDAPVFGLLVEYLLWRAGRSRVSLRDVHPALDGDYDVGSDYAVAARTILTALSTQLRFGERERIVRSIARCVGIDPEPIFADRRFHLMRADALARLRASGGSVELHTHRHVLPAPSVQDARAEIDENKRIVEYLTGHTPSHFCYPDGKYRADHPDWLRNLGILSAATCDMGLNDEGQDPLLLRRLMDRDDLSDLEFESEVVGFGHLVRRLLRRPDAIRGNG